MVLENVVGDLLAYKKLIPGTFQHADQLTTERRTNSGLRNQCFYTADFNLYTIQKRKYLWAITRESQNLILQNVNEAAEHWLKAGYFVNYFPDAKEAQTSLEHPDTVVVDLKGLELLDDHGNMKCFIVDPKNLKKLNSQQRIVAQRIYGPDEENFGLNMEMLAEIGESLRIFAKPPDELKYYLRKYHKKFFGAPSQLLPFEDKYSFIDSTSYEGNFKGLYVHSLLRGVPRDDLTKSS